MASAASFAGMVAGLMLLGLAGWTVITTPASIAENGKQALQRQLQTFPTAQPLPPYPYKPQQPEQNGSLASSVAGAQLVSLLVYWGIIGLQIFLWVLFAVMFKSKVVDPVVDKKGMLKDRRLKGQVKEDDFNNSICGCFEDKWVCIQGWFCPIARMAATNEIAGVMGYWETVGLYCITGIFCNSCLVPCCLTVFFRHQLKSIMNIKDNILNDIIIACCIPNLAICQQGNGVDYESGFELTGCCEFDWLDGSQASNE